MTDLPEFLARIEADFAAERRVSGQTCGLFSELTAGVRSTIGPAMGLLGCAADAAGMTGDKVELDRSTRERVSVLLLRRLYADTNDPRWSSRILEDTVDAVLHMPDATLGDVFAALVRLWEENETALTSPVGNLVKDLAVLCFRRRYLESYQRSDLGWLADQVKATARPATAYLALRTLPVEQAAEAKPAILRALDGTPYADEAVASLDEDG